MARFTSSKDQSSTTVFRLPPYIFFYLKRSKIKVKKEKKGKCINAHFCSTRKALRHGTHSVTCNYTNACLYPVSVHQMAHPQTEVAHI